MRREILCGPAGSGQTRAILDEYVAAVAKHGEDAALLVLPTRLACDRVRAALGRDERVRGLLDARILTFPDLAQRILDANHATVTQVSDLQQRLLMRQVVDQLRAEGALRTLAPICDFPGFVDVLLQDVAEIKRTATRPDEFARRIEQARLGTARNREFARVYARYQQRLQALSLYDDAGRFWQALDELGEGRRRPFEALRTILVDGFDDFTTTQLQVLSALDGGSDVERLVISLCLEQDAERRPELFRRPRRTLERIGEVFGELPVRWLEAPAAGAGPLAAMGARLFAEGQGGPLAEGREAVEVVQASGQRMEVRQVLCRAKRLLQGGVDAWRIALIVRDPGSYRSALSEIARELGLPLNLQASEPVADRPPVQAILDIVRVPAGKLLAADVMRLLKSGYLDRAATGDPELDPDEVERVCATACILGGREESGSAAEAWRVRLRRYAGRLRAELRARRTDDEEQRWFRGSNEEIEAELALIDRVAVALTRLFQCFEPLERARTLTEQVEALAEVMGDFGTLRRLTPADAPEDPGTVGEAAANLAAVEEFLKALRELHGAEEQLGVEVPMDLPAFRDELLRLAQGTSFNPPACRSGVALMDASDARQLAFDHVFVLGMTERQFPRVASEDALFGDDERERLAQAGIALDQRSDSAHEDAFLFYAIAASARERLTLSYPGTDAEGKQALRSYFVDEVERCFEGGVPHADYGLARQVPSPGDAASERELLEAMLFGAFGHDVLLDAAHRDEGVSALRAWGGAYAALPHLHGMIALEDRRSGFLPLDEHDGRLGMAAALEVARLYGPERHFSASALGQYASCPWAFFGERVLGLAEVEEPTEEIAPALIGSIVHRCLRDFFSRWRVHREDMRIEEADREAALSVLDEVIAATFEDEARGGTVGDEVIFAIEREKTRLNLHAWLEFEIREVQPHHTAWATEQRFGYDGSAVVQIGEGEQRVLLRGQVDRIDLASEAEGGAGFVVYDYKTGSAPAKARMLDGGDFQLPIYALAGQQIRPGSVCVDWGYYCLRRPVKLANGAKKKEPLADIEECIDSATDWALYYAAMIRAGEFPPGPRGQCGRCCSFRSICRWDEFRFARKERGEQADE